MIRAWSDSFAVYLDRRVLSLLFLGFSSGLPFGVLADPLSAWLAESGVSKTSIGLFALVSIPYSLKFAWAPLMDRIQLPVLGKWLGRRRSWVLVTQIVLLAVIAGMGLTAPGENLWWTAVFALAVAFSSASQDIVVDAYRVEILDNDRLAAGAATAVFGWRFGQVGSGFLGLVIADLLPWPVVFAGLAALVLVGILAILINPEPTKPITAETIEQEKRVEEFLEKRSHLQPRVAELLAWIYASVICPFTDFMTRRGWVAILLFIALYKFGDAILGIMKVPFFLEIGFTKTEIGAVGKLFGFNAIIFGGLLGGVVLARMGIMRGLVVCGVLMALSNLVFVVQSWVGNEIWMLTVTIAVENVTTGMGTTAFVAYLSSLTNVAYTATQYALLSSFMAVSRTLMSSSAGWLADRMDWTSFFLVTTLAALPGLALLIWMLRAFPAESRRQPAPAVAEAD